MTKQRYEAWEKFTDIHCWCIRDTAEPDHPIQKTGKRQIIEAITSAMNEAHERSGAGELVNMLESTSYVLKSWNEMITRDGSELIPSSKVKHANDIWRKKIDAALAKHKDSKP